MTYRHQTLTAYVAKHIAREFIKHYLPLLLAHWTTPSASFPPPQPPPQKPPPVRHG
jgi:hypothetical protein